MNTFFNYTRNHFNIGRLLILASMENTENEIVVI